MKNVILVIGYNNTRIYDVVKIRNLAKANHNAEIVLCKKSPSKEDSTVVDYTIDVDLSQNQENLTKVLDFLTLNKLNVISVLPFSDAGTQLGSLLAQHFNLKGHNPKKIKAALNKHLFRELENKSDITPQNYTKIKSYLINSLNDLQTLCQKYNNQLFLKPAQEGNSRGCINLAEIKDITHIFDRVKNYIHEGGLIAEELIPKFSNSNQILGQEYSYDHVNGYSFITEKHNTKDGFEYEFIIPAPLDDKTTNKLKQAGEFMANLVGYNGSACHNELVLLNSGQIMAVEPNIRPAGAKIWDSASIAFKDITFKHFNPFKEWILWSTYPVNQINTVKPLNLDYYCGIRFFKAKKSGQITTNIEQQKVTKILSPQTIFEDLKFLKQTGEQVTNILKDNSDFIGYIILKSKDYNILRNDLNKVANFVDINLLIS
jgi:hypothetical protein